jgi:hypothetical protein
MTYPRKYATVAALGQPLDETLDWDTMVDRVNGVTLTGVRAYPYSFSVRNVGGVYDAVDTNANLVYGGSSDAGGVDGADASAVLQAIYDSFGATTGGKIYMDGILTFTSPIYYGGFTKLSGANYQNTFLKIDFNGTLFQPKDPDSVYNSGVYFENFKVAPTVAHEDDANILAFDLTAVSVSALNNIYVEAKNGGGILSSGAWRQTSDLAASNVYIYAKSPLKLLSTGGFVPARNTFRSCVLGNAWTHVDADGLIHVQGPTEFYGCGFETIPDTGLGMKIEWGGVKIIGGRMEGYDGTTGILVTAGVTTGKTFIDGLGINGCDVGINIEAGAVDTTISSGTYCVNVDTTIIDAGLRTVIGEANKVLLSFDVAANQTNKQILYINAGMGLQNVGPNTTIKNIAVSLENAPGAGESLSVTLTDGTTTMTVPFGAADIYGHDAVNSYVWTIASKALLLRYTSSVGCATGKMSVLIEMMGAL